MVSTSISINIENIENLVNSSLTRLLEEIDPTIVKFDNVANEIISVIEDRIIINVLDVRYWFERNLFFLLFGAIIFLILVFILLHLLDALMVKYEFSSSKRHFAGLAVTTAIFIWLFVAVILSACSSASMINHQTLQYILVGLVSLGAVCFILVWIRWLYIHKGHIRSCFGPKRFDFPGKRQLPIQLQPINSVDNRVTTHT